MVMHVDGALGKLIRITRRTRNLTCAEVAELADVSRRHLMALETGANVSVAVVIRVASALALEQVDLGGIAGNVKVYAAAAIGPEVEEALRDLDDIDRSVARARKRLRGRSSVHRGKRRATRR